MTKNQIDLYIEKHPQKVQVLLQKVRKTVKDAAPLSEEGFSYGVPAFKLHGKNLIIFAGFKSHISIYPATTDAVVKAGLAVYKVSKGTLKFPLDKPIPYDLIKKFVKFRVSENNKI